MKRHWLSNLLTVATSSGLSCTTTKKRNSPSGGVEGVLEACYKTPISTKKIHSNWPLRVSSYNFRLLQFKFLLISTLCMNYSDMYLSRSFDNCGSRFTWLEQSLEIHTLIVTWIVQYSLTCLVWLDTSSSLKVGTPNQLHRFNPLPSYHKPMNYITSTIIYLHPYHITMNHGTYRIIWLHPYNIAMCNNTCSITYLHPYHLTMYQATSSII